MKEKQQARYIVVLRPAARRDLDRLSDTAAQRILQELAKLEENPRPRGCKKLLGRPSAWRLRVGVYRVLYEADDKAKLVRIFRVRHRKEVYRP